MRDRRLREPKIRNSILEFTLRVKESKKSLQDAIKLDTNADALKEYLPSKEAVWIFGRCRRLAGPALLSEN